MLKVIKQFNDVQNQVMNGTIGCGISVLLGLPDQKRRDAKECRNDLF
jgi:hypothetical protein